MTPIEKMNVLILYVLSQLDFKTKRENTFRSLLAQILFECDHVSHSLASAITGIEYTIQDGNPKPLDYAGILDSMITAGDLAFHDLGRVQVLIEQVEVDPFVFSNLERRIIRAVIQENVREGRDLYSLTGWESLAEGDPIPYGSLTFSR